MKGSILLYGGNTKDRREKYVDVLENLNLSDLQNNPDILFIEKENKKSIGIKQIKELINFIHKKPFSHKEKAVIIENAGILTREAQNSLLKTLEELPEYATIILSVPTKNSLLPTIISRCKRIKVTSSHESYDEISGEYTYNKIVNSTIGDKLSIASEVSKLEREEVVELLDQWVREGRKVLLNRPSANTGINLRKIIEYRKDIFETNVNLKLALESLLLEITDANQ